MRGNHQIAFSGADTAVVFSHSRAWNRLEAGALPKNGGDPLSEISGTYDHGFTRNRNGWRVNAMTFTATAAHGKDFERNTPGG